ncbi:MAG: hypothetical protein ACTSQB_07005, partial [Candidatus Heimdallarchaeota archaeon]
DNYSYQLSMDEINETRDIIIACRMNGEYQATGLEGGNGPLQLIIPQRFPGDFNGQFCIKYVVTLEILVGE